jgi:carbamoyltransferase
MNSKNITNNKSQYHLGINLGHDRSVALVADGEIIVAIEQERLDRQKHSIGFMHQSLGNTSQIQLPLEAIQYCLKKENLELKELASVTANIPGLDHGADILRKSLPKSVQGIIKTIPSHHLSHAYSAFWPSGFDEAIVLSVDGSGSTFSGMTESYSLYSAKGTTITKLHSAKVPGHLADLCTLGSMYEDVSKKAGFITHVSDSLKLPESGKLMGLAAYGKEQPNWSDWVKTTPGSYDVQVNSYDIALETEVLRKLYDQEDIQKNYLKPYLVDLSFKVQQELEKALLHIIKTAVEKTGIKKLCLAGGVALNSVANYRLLRELELEDIFVFPAAGDNGIAAGNALWAYHEIEKGQLRPILTSASLGMAYNNNIVSSSLDKFENQIEFRKLSKNEMKVQCAQKLSEGYIVALFEGGSEFGPRALGHRSIMADPTFEKMKDVINYRVKFRESFRPFAPVVPIEKVEEIFELHTSSPFMLLVSDIKKEFHKQLPAITHEDGTGRVQTVDSENNPFFHSLINELQNIRKGPAVLLNTSFNIAGQPIVETPEEAINTFLNTDIDFLCVENYWIEKKNVAPKNYEAHLQQLPAPITPEGLGKTDSNHLQLMKTLDNAIFKGKSTGTFWSQNELQQFSAKYARYKQYSELISIDFVDEFQSIIEDKAVIFLNPLGNSVIKSLKNEQEISLNFKDLKVYCFVLFGGNFTKLRIKLRLSVRELNLQILKAEKDLGSLGIEGNPSIEVEGPSPSLIMPQEMVLDAFENSDFNICTDLKPFYLLLKNNNYDTKHICERLKIDDLQSIQPTYLAYYNNFILKNSALDQLIALFLVRGNVSSQDANSLFGNKLFKTLLSIGILRESEDTIHSNVSIYCVDNFFLATDHRFLFMEEDKLNEDPVMYIGSDSLGLVQTAPRYSSQKTLDLCTGSGVQAIVASRYSEKVLAVDINPRAVRFARFNTQLNGVTNVQVILNNLFQGMENETFDTILANPPFVPSPEKETKFRDGGGSGEDVLRAIVQGASDRLSQDGKLYIVTDLVNVDAYQPKVSKWLDCDTADVLVLKTADRNEILFSVPHCHHPYGQDYGDYKKELIKWVNNFKAENLVAVNFGYILIQKHQQQGSYFCKTINNPGTPVHDLTRSYFKTRKILRQDSAPALTLHVAKDIKIKTLSNFNADEEHTEYYLSSENNPFYSEYKITRSMFNLLQRIAKSSGLSFQYSNHKVLLDLIYRGIVEIQEIQPIDKELHQFEELLTQNHLPDLNNFKTTMKNLEIIEFETKTTPTCLTAYLRQ